MASSPESLPGKPAFSNPRTWRQRESLKQGTRICGGRGSGDRTLKDSGHGPQWDAPKSAEGAGSCHCILIIFERSWWLGEVHENWGKANITPIFQNNLKEYPRNYVFQRQATDNSSSPACDSLSPLTQKQHNAGSAAGLQDSVYHVEQQLFASFRTHPDFILPRSFFSFVLCCWK